MEHIDVISFSARLVQADIISGYIPNEPVMGNRDELISLRLNFYVNLLLSLRNDLCEKHDDIDEILLAKNLKTAIELVSAEISCLYISLAPVLYDRDEMISERINYYFQQLIVLDL